jgi:hypothetical protein
MAEMPSVIQSRKLIDGIVRLRRAERIPAAAADVATVRRELEAQAGATLSRSRAALILGVSQTALDRWVTAGRIPTVLTPRGRREVPRQFVVELREAIDSLPERGGHSLAAALAARRRAAERLGESGRAGSTPAPEGHLTAERRSRAYHEVVARRLDAGTIADARARVERLADEGHLHPRHAERWRELLARAPAEVAAAIAADDEAGSDLRQNSPFAGVLNEQERLRIIETVR